MAQASQPESQPQSQPEQLPASPEQGSVQPETLPVQPEREQSNPERRDLDDQLVLPPVNDDDVADDSGDQQGNNDDGQQPQQPQQQVKTPAVADDVDVIEKAWVDRAKQIIKETQDNPHEQERRFEQLQIDYHRKRYGLDIKAKR